MLPEHQKDIHFLNAPDLWPNWPICPVKKYGEQLICGIIFDDDYTVYILNIFSENIEKELDTCEKFIYHSYEEIIQDGWMVD